MMSGLNSYDYGARQYYSVVPAWDRVDPLCEKYYNISPYAYCMGNPIRFIDPDGKAINISGQYQTEALKSIQEYSGESIKLKLDGDKLTLVQPKTYGKAHKNAAVQQPYSVYEDVMKMVIRNIILEMVKIKKWFMKENRMKLLLYLVFFSLSLYSQNSGEFLLIKVKPLKYDCYVLSFASNHRTYQVLTCYDKNLQKGVLVEKGKKYKLFVDKFPREVRIRIDSLRNMLGDVACESVIKSMKEHYPGEVIDTMYVISNVPLNNDGKYINFGGNKIKCRRKQYYFTSLNLNGLYYIKKDY